MNSKKSRALGALIALLMSILMIGCRVQPTEMAEPSPPPAAMTETSPETPSSSGPTVVNTEVVSECDPDILGHCYAPLRSGPHLINEPTYVLNLHDTCRAGEGVDKSGCVPDHGDEVDVLCQISGQSVGDSRSQNNSIWLGVDATDFHTNEDAEVLYEAPDGTPVGLVSWHFIAGAPSNPPNCELVA